VAKSKKRGKQRRPKTKPEHKSRWLAAECPECGGMRQLTIDKPDAEGVVFADWTCYACGLMEEWWEEPGEGGKAA